MKVDNRCLDGNTGNNSGALLFVYLFVLRNVIPPKLLLAWRMTLCGKQTATLLSLNVLQESWTLKVKKFKGNLN